MRQGELTGDAGTLATAVEAYRRALEVRTKEKAPLGWAMIQSNLGNALEQQGELIGDAGICATAWRPIGEP